MWVKLYFTLKGFLEGPLNISLPKPKKVSEKPSIVKEWGCSKKFVQQGRSHFDARSVLIVREHGKRARTPLAAFFNIPYRGVCAVLAPCQTGALAPRQGMLFLRDPLGCNDRKHCAKGFFASLANVS